MDWKIDAGLKLKSLTLTFKMFILTTPPLFCPNVTSQKLDTKKSELFIKTSFLCV